MRYVQSMSIRACLILAIAAAGLSGCASMNLSDLDFMGQSDFNDEISNLEMDYPGADEIPALPEGVRSDAQWDQSAREMQELFDAVQVPDLEPALSPEEFEREFARAQAEAKAYQADDPS